MRMRIRRSSLYSGTPEPADLACSASAQPDQVEPAAALACSKRVLASPWEHAWRMPAAATPWRMVPSTPAGSAYWG
jgi:hypothetical protein